MQRPPAWELTEAIHTTAPAPPGYNPLPATTFDVSSSGAFQRPPAFAGNVHIVKGTAQVLDQEFQVRSSQLAQTLEHELAAARLEVPTHPLPPAEAIIRELGVRNTLMARKTAEFHRQTALGNTFYGSDPLNRPLNDFTARARTMERPLKPDGIAFQTWSFSYRAAHEARLLSQSLQLLNQQQVNVLNWLATVQANDQARIAAEQQAQRAAAELARINEQARLEALAQAARVVAEREQVAAEQHRQQALAEAARQQKEQEEIQAREEARLAALAEAQRLAAEQAQIAADAAAQQIAAEQARQQAQADAQRRMEERQLLAEKTRQEKQQKALRKAQKRRRKKARKTAREQARRQAENALSGQSPVFANAGSMAAFGPTFTGPLGVFGNNPATTLALRTSLRTAVSLALAAISTAAAPVIVGFAALLAPSKLGNGDLYSASVPLSDLAPDLSSDELYQLAAIGGEVDLPVRLGSSTIGDKIEFVVVTTDGLTVPANVPVRAAHFDARTNTYVSTASDTNGPTLTWTPLVNPLNPSTDLPQVDSELPVYDGAEVVPAEGRVDPFPELDRYELGGFITVFPIESGIPPLYVVFSSPYDGAFVRGKFSGRVFNPNQAGGPVLDLDWRSAVISRAGIDAVKLHIARLDQSDANDVMIQRLEEILSGRLAFTDTDLRYYTHENRELERFRALGLSDAFRPDRESPMWNNAHTATLEDFKLEDNESLLYSKDAIAAADKQDELFFRNLLKGGKQ
ncbi:S-type pyocin domain-containing protein [Pseudomonas sp. stari2]|uniref:S-type pyocin domain-containing protein n=1 Tax=Pseudomonas sp. Stari2 TaxID=2954814 RepID=UPI00345D10D2